MSEPEEEFEILNDPEFRAELDRRLESLSNGTAKLLTHEEVFEEIESNRKFK